MSRSRRIPSFRSGVSLAALAAMVTCPALASAQVFGTTTARTAPVPYRTIVSVNPLLLVFSGAIALDIEHRVAPSNTVGVSFASFDYFDANYLTIEARGRYYITGRAFDGLSIGVVGGLARLREDSTDVKDYAMNVGFNVEQQWLVGSEERVALTLGVGASRLFFAEDRPSYKSVLPIFRASIGWGF